VSVDLAARTWPDHADAVLKRRVAEHWEEEPCGTRGFGARDRASFFRAVEQERYAFEPFIKEFAGFDDAAGLRVLEIGVGAGSDYVNWLRAGAGAFGVDLTAAAVQLTRERCALEGLTPRLSRTDCESLPFRDGAFDVAYSYGVIHHSPDTPRAVAEIYRVLKPGGVAKVMIYHAPSITGLLLWMVHCLLKLRPWRSPRWAVANFLESPGTKAYTTREARDLFRAFSCVRIRTVLGTGDLLQMRRSEKYRSAWARLAWRLYPRWAIRKAGGRLGLGMLIEAAK
jgi:ubiquinone/menaquinone biosynthesis C-methylase UbiE